MNSNLFSLKTNLRKLIKNHLKQLTNEEKERQSNTVINYLFNTDRFKNSKHVALYLAMKQEEIDTIPLIEKILNDNNKNKHIYVPYVDMSSKNESEMVFYELKNIDQYNNEMNDNNKYKIKQFNDLSKQTKANENLFDLVIVPGLAFSTSDYKNQTDKNVKRLGRGKGYYDRFLNKIPTCYTIGIGFNQQFLPFNQDTKDIELPTDPEKDANLNEFLCEKIITEN